MPTRHIEKPNQNQCPNGNASQTQHSEQNTKEQWVETRNTEKRCRVVMPVVDVVSNSGRLRQDCYVTGTDTTLDRPCCCQPRPQEKECHPMNSRDDITSVNSALVGMRRNMDGLNGAFYSITLCLFMWQLLHNTLFQGWATKYTYKFLDIIHLNKLHVQERLQICLHVYHYRLNYLSHALAPAQMSHPLLELRV